MNQRTALFAKTQVQGACVSHTIADGDFSNQAEWEAVSFVLLQSVKCADACLLMQFARVWTKLRDKSSCSQKTYNAVPGLFFPYDIAACIISTSCAAKGLQ